MKTDDQKKQLIVLCVLIVIAVAFGAFKLIGKSTHADSELDTQVQVTVTDEKAQTEIAKDTDIDLAAEVKQPVTRDPFEPQLVADRTVAKPKPEARLTPLYKQESDMPLPIFSTEPMIVQEQTAPQADPSASLRLTGVIEGDVDIAIIRGGDGTRYIVREGQRLGKYTIQSISRSGVRLKSASKSVTLTLGGGVTG